MEYKRRLRDAIPGGSHTFSRGADQFPENAPSIAKRGRGVKLWVENGREFIDFGMGLRSVSLGYANRSVTSAVRKSLSSGNNLTLPTLLELRAAEEVIAEIPSVDMVKFAKHGSAAVSAGVRIARAYTGRNLVAVPSNQPFFSYDDWFIGSTKMNRGTDSKVHRSTVTFSYGDKDSICQLFESYGEKIALVIMEVAPTQHEFHHAEYFGLSGAVSCVDCFVRDREYLQFVASMARDYGSLLLIDEIVTGFRVFDGGLASAFDLEPDLTTFGKAIANGFPLSFLGGRREIMELGSIDIPKQERTFLLSTTHGSESSSLAAFLATLDIYRGKGVINSLRKISHKYRNLFNELIAFHELESFVRLLGFEVLPTLSFSDDNGERRLRTVFLHHLIENRVLMPWVSFSIGHDQPRILNQVSQALDAALSAVKHSVLNPNSADYVGRPVMPVFRKTN